MFTTVVTLLESSGQTVIPACHFVVLMARYRDCPVCEEIGVILHDSGHELWLNRAWRGACRDRKIKSGSIYNSTYRVT